MDSRSYPRTGTYDGPANTRRHLRVQPVEVLPDGAGKRMAASRHQGPLDRVEIPGRRPVDPGRPRVWPRRRRYPARTPRCSRQPTHIGPARGLATAAHPGPVPAHRGKAETAATTAGD